MRVKPRSDSCHMICALARQVTGAKPYDHTLARQPVDRIVGVLDELCFVGDQTGFFADAREGMSEPLVELDVYPAGSESRRRPCERSA